jgi:hypothetical protein
MIKTPKGGQIQWFLAGALKILEVLSNRDEPMGQKGLAKAMDTYGDRSAVRRSLS